jgi:hydrophobic/amphiphilic exporter-1 (mainly G- bacteria), HAE1 family
VSITRTIVARPVSILMLFLAVTGAGFMLTGSTPVALFPEINRPVLMILTEYDAGPSQVEEYVTRPLEAGIAGLSGVESMSSTSSEGSSRIVLEFSWRIDLTEAKNDLRDILERTKGRLPDEASTPRVFSFDPNTQPVMTVALSGEFPPETLRRIAEDDVQAYLERVPGVAQAEIAGGRDEVVRVEPEITALAAYGLSVTGLSASIGSANSEASAGSFKTDGRNVLVRADGRFSSLEDIGLVVVGQTAGDTGRPALLREVADVYLGFSDPGSYVTVNLEPAVTISITPESDANTLAVADGVHSVLAELESAVPSGVTLTVTNDNSTTIRETMNEVGSSLLTGAALAMGVLLLFLHNLRAAVIVGVSIPVSLLMTLLAMRAGGVTLNMLSMSGLVLGIGMIVDSSIVVLENIERQRRLGAPLGESAVVGVAEMITPITASALTTISVFAPLMLFRNELGMMGVLFGDISFVIIAAILSSWMVAVMLVPVLASTYIPLRTDWEHTDGIVKRLTGRILTVQTAAETGYAWLLDRSLRYRVVVLSGAIALLIMSVSIAASLGFSYAAQTPSDTVRVNLEFRQGTTLEESERVGREFAEWLMKEVPEATGIVVQSRAGRATVTVTLPPLGERTRSYQEITARVRNGALRWPEITLGFGRGMGRNLGGDPVEVVVQGDDMEELVRVSSGIYDLIVRTFPEVTEPSLSLEDASTQLTVSLIRDSAADQNVQTAAVIAEVRAAFNGITAGRYTEGGQDTEIMVRLPETRRTGIPDIESLPILTGSGSVIPLSSVATTRLEQTPTEITRQEQRRTVTITGDLRPGAPPAGEMPERIKQAIYTSLDIPPSIRISFSGEAEAVTETGGTLGVVFILAVLLVFAVMAGQFESFRTPFVIIFTIPLMVIGVIGIHVVMGQTISMFSLVGLVVLVGIVVNNGIVLVDYTNLLRVRGMSVKDAIREAGRTRLRPIAMTSLTTILGMAPLAFFAGEGGRLTQPVGLTVVGGLFSSTLMTLFVIPVLYSLIAGTVDVRKSDPRDGA